MCLFDTKNTLSEHKIIYLFGNNINKSLCVHYSIKSPFFQEKMVHFCLFLSIYLALSFLGSRRGSWEKDFLLPTLGVGLFWPFGV